MHVCDSSPYVNLRHSSMKEKTEKPTNTRQLDNQKETQGALDGDLGMSCPVPNAHSVEKTTDAPDEGRLTFIALDLLSLESLPIRWPPDGDKPPRNGPLPHKTFKENTD